MPYIKATPQQADAQMQVISAAHKTVESERGRLRDAVAACRKGKTDAAAHLINDTIERLEEMLCAIDAAPTLTANPRHLSSRDA